MKIAVIGAGFAGLATTYFLVEQRIEVDLFDPLPIGHGTSGISAGLMHPFGGIHAHINRMGREGVIASKELLQVAENALGKQVADQNGILRSALSEEQKSDFAECAAKHPDVQWWDREECQKQVPGIVNAPGIYIKSGITVDTETYLQGLWKAAAQKGAHFFQKTFDFDLESKGYDKVIYTTGACAKGNPRTVHLPFRQVKGQLLILEWPKQLPPLPFTLNSNIYIAMHPDQQSCVVGATFERNGFDTSPDEKIAKEELLPRLHKLYPPLKGAHILNCRAGIRATTPDRLPIIEQIDAKTYVFVGLGSKGLLYHALYAKQLVDLLLK